MLVVFILFLVMLVVSAVYMLAQRNLLAVNEDYWNDKAQFAARAGIEHTIAYLTANPAFGSMVLATIPDTAIQDEPDLTYSVEILNNTATDTTVLTAPDGMEIPAGICWVRSTGNLRDRVDSKSTSIVRLVGYQRPILKHALFGMEKLTISNNSKVEGWDSANPPAPPASPGLGNRGDIGTNSTLAGAIKVNGGADVYGEARAGVGTLSANLGTVVDPAGGTIHGLTQISEEATQIPRFIIDPTVPTNPYKSRLAYGDAITVALPTTPPMPPIPGEEAGKRYYHRVPWDLDWSTLGGSTQVPTSSVTRDGPDGIPPTGDHATDEVDSYYLDPPPKVAGDAEDKAEQQIFRRPYIPAGGYRLDPGGGYEPVPPAAAGPPEEVGPGEILIEDAILRRGIYFFQGNVTMRGHINVDPATNATGLPCLIYVDGNLTIEPGAKINWDGYNGQDLNGNGVTDEPLQPRLLQIYSVIDPTAPPPTPVHTVKVGDNPGARTYASFVACGANMNLELRESEYYGGVQTREASVLHNTNAYFDIDLYGKPLEGRGELAVLVSTVSVYRTSAIAAAGPPPAPAPAPGPGPSAPAPATYTTSGWCSPCIPLPMNSCAY
jgi:hypothetical protein